MLPVTAMAPQSGVKQFFILLFTVTLNSNSEAQRASKLKFFFVEDRVRRQK
jgi:hypothetical protein